MPRKTIIKKSLRTRKTHVAKHDINLPIYTYKANTIEELNQTNVYNATYFENSLIENMMSITDDDFQKQNNDYNLDIENEYK